MKKLIICLSAMGISLTTGKAFAQEEKSPGKMESQEIIIQKKGDKDANISVQINGDQIIVNGKPLSEYNDDNITVRKKRMIISNGDKIIMDSGDDTDDSGPSSFFSKKNKKAFLGVSTEKHEKGARVNNVSEGSAAEKAGLREGDIITKINEDKIDGPQALINAIGKFSAGDEITVTYIREDKKPKNLTAKLGAREEEETKVFSFGSPDGGMRGFTFPDMDGIFDFTPEPARKQKLGIKIQDTENDSGVRILEVENESAGEAAGLSKDDIIIEINGHKITNTDEAREELKESAEKDGYRILALRNGKEMKFEVKIPKKLKTADL